jgi:hypothetical protein
MALHIIYFYSVVHLTSLSFAEIKTFELQRQMLMWSKDAEGSGRGLTEDTDTVQHLPRYCKDNHEERQDIGSVGRNLKLEPP